MTSSMKRMREIFYGILDRKIDMETANREIEKIKKTKVIKGYIHGMKGILQRRRKKYSINPKEIDKKEAREILKIVKRNLENPFLPDFEKGYFYAWKDFLTKKIRSK
jgi:hypothetical protein